MVQPSKSNFQTCPFAPARVLVLADHVASHALALAHVLGRHPHTDEEKIFAPLLLLVADLLHAVDRQEEVNASARDQDHDPCLLSHVEALGCHPDADRLAILVGAMVGVDHVLGATLLDPAVREAAHTLVHALDPIRHIQGAVAAAAVGAEPEVGQGPEVGPSVVEGGA